MRNCQCVLFCVIPFWISVGIFLIEFSTSYTDTTSTYSALIVSGLCMLISGILVIIIMICDPPPPPTQAHDNVNYIDGRNQLISSTSAA